MTSGVGNGRSGGPWHRIIVVDKKKGKNDSSRTDDSFWFQARLVSAGVRRHTVQKMNNVLHVVVEKSEKMCLLRTW